MGRSREMSGAAVPRAPSECRGWARVSTAVVPHRVGFVPGGGRSVRVRLGADAELVLGVRSSMDDETFEATMRATLDLTW